MSSGSSGRYQSRLFNFVNQQSRRLTEQWENTFRHLQVATKWGVELLLYPVYLLFVSSESDAKTLHTKEPQSRLNLPSNDTDFQPETDLNVDTPIEHVLETVYYLSSEEVMATPKKTSQSFNPLSFLGGFWQKPIPKNSAKTNIIHSPAITENSAASIKSSQPKNALKQHLAAIRGIATNLLNRNLVLVTAENEILDILTPQQQAKLEDKIISEVANYWQFWRLSEAKRQKELLPKIEGLLAKLTGENSVNIPILNGTTSKTLLDSGKLLTFLDVAVAKVESNALIPVQQRSQEIIQVVQTQLNIFIYGKEQLSAKGEIAVTADDLETHALNFQALIEAALNYFFGVGNRKTLESTTADNQPERLLSSYPKKALFKNRNLQNQDLTDDPWLTWNDLFGDRQKVADKAVTLENTTPALASSLSAGLSWPKNLHRQQPKAKSELVQRKKTTRHLASIPKTSAKVTSFQQTQGEISQQQFSQSTEVEAQPDWIETKATAMGYEKHPLEKVLEWLDRVILWLEETFAKIFQSLQRVWEGNK
ncbi:MULTISPECIES: hypothetical protein [Nostoc]|uniref:Uncharacterized protein n=1 Tax=Nostoc paludosum FACHB-159 TaxID=2692908 RepID=A0ABR8KAM4_9NOSO|nr:MULTISPECIES: hypothetical protein [Nostoc]MBD2680307.1 hypothetical protein [Nostoc sp. FACHB-857]MBD2735933.1 hypothetical protein [Nostoc paludosum FACHB-159]